jgi:hypothetical protein
MSSARRVEAIGKYRLHPISRGAAGATHYDPAAACHAPNVSPNCEALVHSLSDVVVLHIGPGGARLAGPMLVRSA